MVVLGPHRACSSPANIVSIGQNVRPNEFSGAHRDSSTWKVTRKIKLSSSKVGTKHEKVGGGLECQA